MHATFSTSSLSVRFGGFSLTVQGAPVGLPTTYESWKTAVFGTDAGDPSISAPEADSDGDGRTNANEFLSLTDPNDGGDFASVSLARTTGGSAGAGISGKAGRIYALDRSWNLENDWIELVHTLPLQTDGPQILVDPFPSVTQAFYRFRIFSP